MEIHHINGYKNKHLNFLGRRQEIEFKLKKYLPIKQIMLDYHFKTFSHFTTFLL